MSSKLDDFLELGNVTDIQNEITVKVGGKNLTLKIRAMTEGEHTDFQKRAQNFKGKTFSFDTGKYNSLVIPACVVEPNFNSADFLAKAGCQTAWDFLSKKFPAGALADIAQKIQELSGFETFDMEIENAKN